MYKKFYQPVAFHWLNVPTECNQIIANSDVPERYKYATRKPESHHISFLCRFENMTNPKFTACPKSNLVFAKKEYNAHVRECGWYNV